MQSYSGPLFLGIDYGTTRVKASILTEDDLILSTYSISWNEANCNKYFLSDWLKILKKVVRGVFDQCDIGSQFLVCVAITTMSPCIVLLDPRSEYSSSPIILYDEVLSLNQTQSRTQRVNSAIKILNGFTPNSSNTENFVLTVNAWLVWQLTGELVIDNYSLHDILGDAQKNDIIDARFPDKVLSPAAVAGTMKQRWSGILNIPLNVKVCCGSTDTVALVRATKLKAGEYLVYLGTFFSLLEAKIDFSNGIPSEFVSLPYKWHIPLEGGALIERLAASYFPLEESRNNQIAKYLEVAKNNLEINEKIMRTVIARKTWTLGTPVQMLPVLLDSNRINNSLPNLAVIPFISFAQALKVFFDNNKKVELVHVIGGLSSHKWITHFIGEYANIQCSSKINIVGAEGAALLAKDGMCDA